MARVSSRPSTWRRCVPEPYRARRRGSGARIARSSLDEQTRHEMPWAAAGTQLAPPHQYAGGYANRSPRGEKRMAGKQRPLRSWIYGDYLQALGIRLLSGRLLDDRDRTGSVAVL